VLGHETGGVKAMTRRKGEITHAIREASMRLTTNTKYVIAISIATSAVVGSVIAQQGITRTPLGTIDFPPGYQTVMGLAQIPAGTCFERHAHAGVENFYIIEGELDDKIEGKPDQHFKAGDSGQIAAGVPHSGCTTAALKVLTVHIVEKGKPFATPAP
jgi:quercetin dioxygenase-like cupin family protein